MLPVGSTRICAESQPPAAIAADGPMPQTST